MNRSLGLLFSISSTLCQWTRFKVRKKKAFSKVILNCVHKTSENYQHQSGFILAAPLKYTCRKILAWPASTERLEDTLNEVDMTVIHAPPAIHVYFVIADAIIRRRKQNFFGLWQPRILWNERALSWFTKFIYGHSWDKNPEKWTNVLLSQPFSSFNCSMSKMRQVN